MALKGLPSLVSPELLWVLAAMGHGDVLAVVDRNYPAHARHRRTIVLPGATTTEVIRAVTRLLPIDDFVDPASYRMTPDGEPHDTQPVHAEVASALATAEGRPVAVAPLERTAFYEHAGRAFACVSTGDDRSYACFLLTKGVIRATDSG